MIFPRFTFLKEDEQILLESFTEKSVKNGPGVFFIKPFIKATKRKGTTLSPNEFLKIKNIISGKVKVERGPKLVFLEPNEEILKQQNAFILKHNEYLKLIDETTGQIRVEVGEKTAFPEAYEELLVSTTEGINIDEHTGVLIRNTKKGSLNLITDRGVYFPNAEEEIVDIREKILLENHETVIVKEKDGNYRITSGNDAENSFFLLPYEELLTLYWSSGIHKERRDLHITHIDTRPKFMWYEFSVRTKDNVELIVGITFFWQILDISKMIRTTDDAPGDVCSHARSTIIQSVSKSTLDKFLDRFNEVIKSSILDSEDSFYDNRGVKIHSVEVRSITCKDIKTQTILAEIIQETTDRLNRLQKQESENEVRLNKIKGKIEAEKTKGELIRVNSENSQKAAEIEGKSEAIKVKAFFDTLDESLSEEKKTEIFSILKKESYIEKLGQSNARMFFTPKEIDLSIESRGE